MKKHVILLLTAGLLLFTGCSNHSDVAPSGTETPQQEHTSDNKAIDKKKGKEATATAPKDSHYSWQEISVTLPHGWADKCVIVDQDNGFSIFQKASYEKEEGLGFICGFQRSNEYWYYGAGETLLAYTDDGVLYYLMQPTDVACDVSQEDIVDEYGSMCGQVEELKASVQITASDLHLDAEEYILPTSNILPLDSIALANLSGNDLWIAKNELFARHGRQFTNSYLQMYFDRCSWYNGTIPTSEFDDHALSRLELDNLELILDAIEDYNKAHPYPKTYSTSDTAKADLTGNGKANRISYKVKPLGDWEYKCELTIDKHTYVISDMIYMASPVTDAFYITDISEMDDSLEIAILDYGPSDDPVTYFFRYDGGNLSLLGEVDGFPFTDQTGGPNGFDGLGNITGRVRMDLIETTYLEGYWRLDGDEIVYQDYYWHKLLPGSGHTLYEDLPVHLSMDDASGTTTIAANTKVYFMGSDMEEWILVRGKDGSKGYLHVKDGNIVDLGVPADQVISDLNYFD